jgi:hypothetical protein
MVVGQFPMTTLGGRVDRFRVRRHLGTIAAAERRTEAAHPLQSLLSAYGKLIHYRRNREWRGEATLSTQRVFTR